MRRLVQYGYYMWVINTVFVLFLAVFLPGCSVGDRERVDAVSAPPPLMADNRMPVLVELFTSEGCSSCPPADKLLTSLSNDQPVANAEAVTLEFHVDYWDRLGWKDRFSSASNTNRQQAYSRRFRQDSVYTPQMVVDGTSEFVGSDRSKSKETIATSAGQAKGTITIDLAANKLKAKIAGLTAHHDATVYLAIAESKLTTKVGGGENSGSTLEHTSVVRNLIPIGSITASENTSNVESAIALDSGWRTENLKYVIFVQENDSLKVLAVKQVAR